jgi:hypothetical protein
MALVGKCQGVENLASLAKRFSRPGCLARFPIEVGGDTLI